VGHKQLCQRITARVTLKISRRQLGQLSIVAARQCVADDADVFLDDEEVVDQPLGGGRDRLIPLDGFGQNTVCGTKRLGVGVESSEQRIPATEAALDIVPSGQGSGFLFETLDAQDLVTDWIETFTTGTVAA
jgi:hypothetical protein